MCLSYLMDLKTQHLLEKCYYKIAQEFMPAPKATYANVSVNGVLVGLYVCVQSVDDDFTNENFYERKGPFFKAENTGINNQLLRSFKSLGSLFRYFMLPKSI